MTSQLNVDTIVDKAGSGGTNVKIGNTSTYVADGGSATQNAVQGMLKCWSTVEMDNSNNIPDSFNSSGITDNGTGDFTFTATNLMASRSACAFGSNQSSRARFGHYINPLTNGINVQPTNSSGSYVDDDTSTALIGDLA